eukprot:TRINITY_DN5806_c0_g1_i1.p1 TRINITY_DN5806_c0_g1~~TRINITY_DN5806_c0_g1_i1.p1  ORF type:complete len:460 (+),score=129.45 TRINITY_DN5806_c0_g1_i1:54-1382(+)
MPRKKGRSPTRPRTPPADARPLLAPVHPQPKTAYEWFVNAVTFVSERETGERCASAVPQWARCRRAIDTAALFGGGDPAETRRALLAWLADDWAQTHDGKPCAPLAEADVPGGEWARPQPDGCSDEAPAAEAAGAAAAGTDAALPASGPSWDDDADDEEVKRVLKEKEYWGRGMWKEEESGQGQVESWDMPEVETFIRDVGRKHAPKYHDLFTQFALAAGNAGWNGRLLLASNPNMLTELVLGSRAQKWPEGNIKIQAAKVWHALRDMETCTYRKQAARLQHFFPEDSQVLQALHECLRPHPREDVRYVLLRTRGVAGGELAVDAVESDVSHYADPEGAKFKVVCACSSDTPQIVSHNFIYKRSESQWRLLVSVDFLRHGEAMPGHWHLNRAPLGELVPHWGPGGDVWHGEPSSCPVWWQLIPDGLKHREIPERRPVYEWCE